MMTNLLCRVMRYFLGPADAGGILPGILVLAQAYHRDAADSGSPKSECWPKMLRIITHIAGCLCYSRGV